jgi:hypothetical protein
MKHLLELLLCGTIGSYCLWRAASVLPRALAEAHAVVRMATERRRREIEARQATTANLMFKLTYRLLLRTDKLVIYG